MKRHKRWKTTVFGIITAAFMAGSLLFAGSTPACAAENYTVTVDMAGHGEDLSFQVMDGRILVPYDRFIKTKSIYHQSGQSQVSATMNGDIYFDLAKKPLSSYSGILEYMQERESGWPVTIHEDTTFYALWIHKMNTASMTVETPVCGTVVKTTQKSEEEPPEQTNGPKLTFPKGAKYSEMYEMEDGSKVPAAFWITASNPDDAQPFNGTVKGGQKMVGIAYLSPKWGYTFESSEEKNTVTINSGKLLGTVTEGTRGCIGIQVGFEVTAKHDWDDGKVTKKATASESGVKTYTCKGCGKTKTESYSKSDSSALDTTETALGVGASEKAAEKAILALTSDKDPAGTVYQGLQLKADKVSKTAIRLKWKKQKGAVKYVLYGNRCGKKNSYQKLAIIKGKTSYTVKKAAGKKVKKGTYYKFLMVAVDKNGKVISTSKTVHEATKGGKYGNPGKVTTKAKKDNVSVKKKGTFALKAKSVAASKKLKVQNHRAVCYESGNPKIASVTKKGVIKGKKKGTCYVYAYAQNGLCKKIKVTVK